MSILVLGTVALDTVATPFGKRENMLGGSAVHFSMAARLFVPVNLVAIVGADFPENYVNFLRQKGVNLSSLRRTSGKTFKWSGEYKGDLNTAFTLNTELGVLLEFLPEISAEQKKIRHIFLANVDPELQGKLLDAIDKPRLVGLDSMNFWINNKRKQLESMLKRVTIYVANDAEARSLSGEDNLLKAAKKLRAMGPEMILIKKGEHGVVFYCDSFVFAIPAYPTDAVVDPTGAGDTFAGGFMGYLAREKKFSREAIKKAIAYGTIAASFNVEDFGIDRTVSVTARTLEARLNKFKKIVLF